MKKTKNRFCAVLICLITAVCLISVQALAAVYVDKEKECCIKIEFAPEDIKASFVNFNVYKVASVTPSYEFEVEAEFENRGFSKLLNNPDEESYGLITASLKSSVASDRTVKPCGTAKTDSSGIAVFEGLEAGLYFITGEVFEGEKAYYTPSDFLISLPNRLTDDSWEYSVFSEIKWEKRLKNEPLNLEVQKIWSDSAENLHTSDSITVKLYKDSVLFDTQILNCRNNWRYKWENLSGGASFTVKEDDFIGYDSTVERSGDCFIITNTPQKTVKNPSVFPKTGLLMWPIPILAAVGILFILIGINIKRKGEK